MKKLSSLFVVSSLIILGISCAHLPLSRIADEEILMQRVKGAWDARIKKDWDTVYDFTWEGYKKEVPRKQFIEGANLDVLRFEIKDFQIWPEEKRAEVTISFDISYMGFQLKNSKFKEEWAWEKENWFFKLKPLKTFSKKK